MVQQARGTSKAGARSLADVLARRVRARRGDLLLTQGKLAERVNGYGPFGWTHATVSRIEAGDAVPSLDELVALAFGCEATIQELLDPVVAGGAPVDLGLNKPTDAEEARRLLSGGARVHSRGTRRRTNDV